MVHIKRLDEMVNNESLNKDAYWNKHIYAERRNKKSREYGTDNGLTDEQCDALESLARVRHELHANKDKIIYNDEMRLKNELIKVNIELENAGLEPMDFVPTDESDYIDIDSISDLIDFCDGNPFPESGTKEWQDRYDEEYFRISGELEELNSKIEKYLGMIDQKYGTNYRPTGMSRF